MDQIDRRIVALLQENARRSFQDIGGKVSLSAPAVKRRVDRLEEDGVVTGYSAAIDPEKFGWHSHAFVGLYCEGRMAGVLLQERNDPAIYLIHITLVPSLDATNRHCQCAQTRESLRLTAVGRRLRP